MGVRTRSFRTLRWLTRECPLTHHRLVTLIGGVCQYDHDRTKEGNKKQSGYDDGATANQEQDEPEPFQIVPNQSTAMPSTYYGEERPH